LGVRQQRYRFGVLYCSARASLLDEMIDIRERASGVGRADTAGTGGDSVSV